MKRVLVTGATGFVGRQTLDPLSWRGFEVHGVGSRDADLLDARAARHLVETVRPTHLLHLAWYAVPGRFWEAPQNLDWLAASLALLRTFAEAGGERAVTAGTGAEYDWSVGGVLDETATPLQPATLYGASKSALASVAGAWSGGPSHAHGRLFWLHGPHEQPGRLVSSVAAALRAGEPAACSPGTQVRDFLHVTDAGEGFAALVDSDLRGPVNVCSGTGIAVRALVERLAAALGRPELPRFGVARAAEGQPAELVGASERLRTTGWAPHRTIEDTAAWWATAAC